MRKATQAIATKAPINGCSSSPAADAQSINGRAKALRAGDLLLIEKNDRHEIRNTGPHAVAHVEFLYAAGVHEKRKSESSRQAERRLNFTRRQHFVACVLQPTRGAQYAKEMSWLNNSTERRSQFSPPTVSNRRNSSAESRAGKSRCERRGDRAESRRDPGSATYGEGQQGARRSHARRRERERLRRHRVAGRRVQSRSIAHQRQGDRVRARFLRGARNRSARSATVRGR